MFPRQIQHVYGPAASMKYFILGISDESTLHKSVQRSITAENPDRFEKRLSGHRQAKDGSRRDLPEQESAVYLNRKSINMREPH